MTRRHVRYGFTLYHLLVVLALLGLLLALLFPLIQKARERAKVLSSQNNLKQMMIAAHSYQDANGTLPPGNIDNNFSAHSQLLPYIEQGVLYHRIDFMKPCDDKANATVRQSGIIVYVSPADPQVLVINNVGPTNYLYVAGTKASLVDNDGVFYQNSKVRLQNVTDGTSFTFAIVETLKGDGMTKAVDVRRQHVLLKADALKGLKEDAGVADFKNNKNVSGMRGASWIDGRFLQGTINAGRGINDERPDVSCAGLGGWGGPRSLTKKVNVAMCDGSVREVRETVSLKTWRALATRAANDAIGKDW